MNFRRLPVPLARAACLVLLCPAWAGAQSSPAAAPQTPAQSTAAAPQQSGTPQHPAPAPGDYPEDTSQPAETGPTFRTTVNEVNLVFTVTDAKTGKFVRDLKQNDFELLDNRRPPARVFRFTQQTDLPLRAGLLIDTSSSIHGRFGFEQQASVDFLQQVIRRNLDQAFVMGFDTRTEITAPFTNNVDALAHGVNALKSNGGTALFDALYTACTEQMLPLKSDEQFRKTLVLLSDGHDNQSHSRMDEAIKSCQRAETIVYTISTNTSPTKDTGDDVMAHIAEQTGGRFFIPMREDDVGRAFEQIQDELRSQYSLEYRPADFKANGEFRKIWLESVNRDYKVRAKKGYFAPRQ